MKRNIKRTVAFGITTIILTTNLYGCGKTGESIPTKPDSMQTIPEVETDQVVSEVVADIMEDIQQPETTEEIVAEAIDVVYSQEWEDYVGDFETFAYGLMINDLKYGYEVFPAYVELSDGECISGIGYTDYSECYSNDDETEYVFSAGLIPYCGELDIPEEEVENGLFLCNLDYPGEDAGFFLEYGGEEYTDHCIVYDKYMKYGIDEKGKIFYEVSDYDENTFDKSIGSLYSYDKKKYIYDTDFGKNVTITGESLSAQMDFDEIEKEINKILEEQDYNFASVDVDTYAYMAQEAVESYLLSLQQETFMGYDVQTLISLAGELDPTECYRITSDGLMVVDFDVEDPNSASAFTKWTVGSVCVVLMAVGMVGSVVCMECPALSSISGAVAGVAVDVFMQVVIESRNLDDVNWGKVALSAATGAISGLLGPYAMAKFAGTSYFMVDSALDGMLGAMEHTIIAWAEGADGEEIIKQMGYGFALGFGLSAGFKVIGKGLSSVIAKAGEKTAALSEKLFPKLTKKLGDFSENVLKPFGNELTEKIYTLKKVADNSIFHSRYISQKMAWRQIERIVENSDDELLKKAFDSLKADDILDDFGNKINKKELMELFQNAADGEKIGHFVVDGEIVQIIKKNGVTGIVFDNTKYQTVSLPFGIINDRDRNFEEAAKKFIENWSKDSSLIPPSIADAIEKKGIELSKISEMDPDVLVSIIRHSEYVMHENIDMMTVTLVTRNLHDKTEGGISHMGGFALAKYLKEHMATEFFDRFIAAASSAVATTN